MHLKLNALILFLFTGEASSLCSQQLAKGQTIVSEDTEMADEALDASCEVTSQDTTGAKGQSQDSTKGQCGS